MNDITARQKKHGRDIKTLIVVFILNSSTNVLFIFVSSYYSIVNLILRIFNIIPRQDPDDIILTEE